MARPRSGSLPPLRWDGDCWVGTHAFEAWTRRGKPTRASVHVYSPGHGGGDVVEDPQEPAAAQSKAWELLLTSEERVAASVVRAVHAHYTPELRDEYGYEGDEADELMPEVESDDDLLGLLTLRTVHVLGVARRGVAYVGFEFRCTWDDEHGLGVMVHRARVVKLGGGATAFLGWIARQDAGG